MLLFTILTFGHLHLSTVHLGSLDYQPIGGHVDQQGPKNWKKKIGEIFFILISRVFVVFSLIKLTTLSSELRITRAGTAYTCSVDEVTEAVEVTHGGITGSGTRYGMAILVGPLFTNSEYGEVSRELEL